MTTNELKETIEQLREYEELSNEVTAMIDSLKDSLKAELTTRNCEELTVDGTGYTIRYTTVLSNRFNSTAFKKAQPDVYKAYLKPVSSRRFTVSD